jgi:hypothetical protein
VLEQIREVGEHRAKSQWLYMTELGETPTFFNDKYILSYKQLPHIITPLEKKLGSGKFLQISYNFYLLSTIDLLPIFGLLFLYFMVLLFCKMI